MIASADDRALPVLGYSDSGTIDWEKLPDNMRAWLKQYDQAMATLGHSKDFVDGISKRGQKTRAPKAAIDPLVKTTWYQDAPYNNKVPLYDGAEPDLQGKPSPTGCVATAMAQIMNYYQWPKAACEPIPEYEYSTSYENQEKIVHIDALPSTTFDWDHMIDQYEGPNGTILGTEAEQDAVATLMRYCGQSVYMNYYPEFSGSDHQQVVEALIYYFGYKNTARWVKRIQYSIDGWEDLVYSELATGRPVQYGGDSDGGGHSFICDGYDGGGLFHINWGWGGSGDGFFSLAVLNPYDNSSTGSSSSGIGYSLHQDMVIGIDPDIDGTSPKLPIPRASLYEENPLFVVAADSVGFNYFFTSLTYQHGEVLADFAVGPVDADGTLLPVFMGDPADSIVNFFNTHFVGIDSTAFEPGEVYHLCPMVKYRSLPGADWQLLGAPDEFYFVAGRTPEGKFLLYRDIAELEIMKAEFTKGLGRIGMRNDLTLTIRNHSDIESTIPLYFVPFYYGNVKPADITADTPYSQGEPLVVGGFIRAAQDSKATFCFKPMASGTINLLLAMPDGLVLANTIIEVSDVIGSYDDYVRNESYYELSPGKVVYHVCMSDNPEANIPQGRPDEKVTLYAEIKEIGGEGGTSQDWSDEAIGYLSALPEKGGDGTYTLSEELTLDVELGKRYSVRSCFSQLLEGGDVIASAPKSEEFTVDETGVISVIRENHDNSPYIDLRGIRTYSLPIRKGLYLHNGRKVIIK